MNTRVMLALVGLMAMPIVSLAADEPKLSCLKDFTFSQDFLSRHPNAGAACREVVVKQGQKWARFDAQVVDIKDKDAKNKEVTVNFVGSANQTLDTLTFTASPEARVSVNDHEMTYKALGKGDRLSFWIPESRAGFYATPGATKLTEVKVARTQG